MISRFVLTPAEMAVLVEYMAGAELPLDQAAQTDLGIGVEQLSLAEERLLERGLLVQAPLEEEISVSSTIVSVLEAILAPQLLCVLRVVQREREAPPAYFSFTQECVACNYVNQDGQHICADLGDEQETVAVILSSATQRTYAERPQSAETRSLDQLLQAAETLAILLVVADPAQPQATAHSLSWLEAGGGLWLVEPLAQSSRPCARPIDTAELKQTIASSIAAHYPTRQGE